MFKSLPIFLSSVSFADRYGDPLVLWQPRIENRHSKFNRIGLRAHMQDKILVDEDIARWGNPFL